MNKYNLEPQDANFVTSLVYIISAAASPFFGFVIDKTGRNVFWVFVSVITTIVAHSLLAFTDVNPYLCMVCILTMSLETNSNSIHFNCIFYFPLSR